jgi:K+-transporting ATPase KdpF subunit
LHILYIVAALPYSPQPQISPFLYSVKQNRRYKHERKIMSFAIAGVIALALLAYLVYAMFNPEKFK